MIRVSLILKLNREAVLLAFAFCTYLQPFQSWAESFWLFLFFQKEMCHFFFFFSHLFFFLFSCLFLFSLFFVLSFLSFNFPFSGYRENVRLTVSSQYQRDQWTLTFYRSFRETCSNQACLLHAWNLKSPSLINRSKRWATLSKWVFSLARRIF